MAVARYRDRHSIAGRKSDKLDSAWLAAITERGALRGSFVPPEGIRQLRARTRYRRHLVRERTAEKQRAEKLLEDGPEAVIGAVRHPRGCPAGRCWTPS